MRYRTGRRGGGAGRAAGKGPAQKYKAPPTLAEVTLERLAWGGRAVGRTPEGKVVFVAKAAPGDKVLARLERQKSHYGEGRVHAVLSPSPDRVPPKCKFFSHCGGCQWLCVSGPRQRAEKEEMLRWALRDSLGGMEPEALVWAEPEVGYRHRGEFHVHPTGGSVLMGFYQDASHKVINLDTCPLFSARYNEVYGEVRRALKAHPGAGEISRMALAASEGDGAFAAHLHIRRGASPDAASRLVDSLLAAGLEGVLATPERRPGEVLALGGDAVLTYGVEYPAGDGRGEVELRVGVRTFTQAHYALNRRLVHDALAWLEPDPGERLLDLYAGAGNFSVPAAHLFGDVVAVESAPWACEDGVTNAGRLGLGGIRHLCGDAPAMAAELAAAGERFDAVLLDPPRTGAAEVIPALEKLRPSRILYVSCNLPTLGRDLGLLREAGYRLVRVRGFDLFPQTYSLETLCLLENLEAGSP